MEADIIWDSEFIEFLKSRPKFDAITVWLIGTHGHKTQCRNIPKQTSSGHYRLTVQNNVYLLANEILRMGGVLQIVDRGEVPENRDLIAETIAAHKEQAQGTTLDVIHHQFRIYEEPNQGTAIPTVLTVGTSGRLPEVLQLAMTSIISIKR